jgi:ubiquinone/menaquinone biosynthesis C-methylase UbiE/DNA-binding transcriptional ArsR family regulator
MNEATVFERLNSLSDETRGRLLHVLERRELTVSELVTVMQLPQSTVSRHLRILADEGWVTSRAEGTSRFYRMANRLQLESRRLWELVRESLAGSRRVEQDEERAREVVARRRTRSQEFFSTTAGQWDSVREELFGGRPEFPALLALLDPSWVLGDLGCGTGQLSVMVAPYVSRVVAVDESVEMLSAARRRLSVFRHGEVDLREGRLESLPVASGTLDAAVLSLVLHYVPAPDRALSEAARVLRDGGRVLIVDMVAHDRREYRETMGHLWPGFTEAQIADWLRRAGFQGIRQQHLPLDEEAKGPVLFAATGTKS